MNAELAYSWGVIPVPGWIGRPEFATSLFPKNSRYLLPVKVKVREAEELEEGDEVRVELEVK